MQVPRVHLSNKAGPLSLYEVLNHFPQPSNFSYCFVIDANFYEQENRYTALRANRSPLATLFHCFTSGFFVFC